MNVENKNTPKISIIVPVYNVENYIKRCLDSLVNQTFKDIEIIIVNDKTPDNSMDICYEYARNDSRIKIFNKQINEGLGITRNFGIEKSQGEYISFVDSDDYVSLNMCEKLYNTAKNCNADVVYGGIYYDDSNGNIKAKKYTDDVRIIRDRDVKQLLLDLIATKPKEKDDTIMEVSVWKAIFKREIFVNQNIRFVSERVFISEDVIFNIDYLSKCNCIAVIPDCIYYYSVNPKSLSKVFRTDRFKKVKELYYEIVSKLDDLYDKNDYQERTDRFLIARARTNAKKIIKHKNIIGKKESREALKEICNDNELCKILNKYPIFSLPKKYALIALLMKHKNYSILELLLYKG